MGRPTAASIDIDTPTRVLDAAERAFALAGLAGAKLADIASAAGIRRPSLLYHFASKENLYAAVVERGFDVLGEALAEAMGAGGAKEDFDARLERVLAVYVDFLDSRPELARLFVRQLIDGESPGQRIVRDRVVPLLDRVSEWIRNEGGPRVRDDLPVRSAVLQVCASILLRTASGSLRNVLWGPDDDDRAMLLALLAPTDATSLDADAAQ